MSFSYSLLLLKGIISSLTEWRFWRVLLVGSKGSWKGNVKGERQEASSIRARLETGFESKELRKIPTPSVLLQGGDLLRLEWMEMNGWLEVVHTSTGSVWQMEVKLYFQKINVTSRRRIMEWMDVTMIGEWLIEVFTYC